MTAAVERALAGGGRHKYTMRNGTKRKGTKRKGGTGHKGHGKGHKTRTQRHAKLKGGMVRHKGRKIKTQTHRRHHQ